MEIETNVYEVTMKGNDIDISPTIATAIEKYFGEGVKVNVELMRTEVEG